MDCWYLVRCAGDEIPEGLPVADYWGIGWGDEGIWPVPASGSSYTSVFREALRTMEKHREYVCLGGIYWCVCAERGIAEQYWRLLREQAGWDSMLLEVSGENHGGGVDFGDPSGGYSVIETEIIGRVDVEAARLLDPQTGLFPDLETARRYVESLPQDGTVEYLGSYQYVYVRRVL